MSNRATVKKEEKRAARRWMKIGEVAKRSGVAIETLRFYERVGLLGSPGRTASGYRLYDERTIERLDFIKRAQVLGFTLTEIGRLIAEKESGQSPCSEVREIVRRRLKEIDERMKQMQRYRKELAAALSEWDEAGDVEGHICGLIEDTDIRHPLPAERSVRKGKR